MTLDLKSKYVNSSGRSKEAVKNIIISTIARGVSMICSLLLVPITINYVNPTRYGIWLTLSSIISWILLFDFGLGNGLRNRFAEAKAKGDMELVRQYVSTTYYTLGAIMLVLFIVVAIANLFIDWPMVLNVDTFYAKELKWVFGIVTFFFCISLVVNLITTILTADQKPGLSSVLLATGQFFSLVVVYVLTLTTDGSLFNLALYYSGIPMLVTFVVSVYTFRFTRYKSCAPQFGSFRRELVRSITGLGVKFFVICLSMLFIFQIMNIILSRELGPEAVTEYNIVFKYFNILTTFVIIIVTPFWSAFTDAYQKKDYQWMISSRKKLEIIWFLSTIASIVMVVFSNPFYDIWVGDDVHIHLSTTISIAIYVSLFNLGQIYMYMINGVGTVMIQLVIFFVFALIAWPLMVLSCRWLGLPGIVIVPSLVVLMQAIFGKIQIGKIVKDQVTGLWGR
jgi:O-antigen/teichoic acid export membrane protein